MKIMRTTMILNMLFFATMSAGQGKPDDAAMRNILQEEGAAGNKGGAPSAAKCQRRLLTGTKKYLKVCFAELCSVRMLFRSASSAPRPPWEKRLHGFRGF